MLRWRESSKFFDSGTRRFLKKPCTIPGSCLESRQLSKSKKHFSSYHYFTVKLIGIAFSKLNSSMIRNRYFVLPFLLSLFSIDSEFKLIVVLFLPEQ